MGWDSNPRIACAIAGFQVRCIQPLCHPSRFGKSTRKTLRGTLLHEAVDTQAVSVGPAWGWRRSHPVTSAYKRMRRGPAAFDQGARNNDGTRLTGAWRRRSVSLPWAKIARPKGESMTARHWMQIAALTSAMGLTGAAIAQNTEGTTVPDDRGSVSRYGTDTPSSGAIVTPGDKARGMGRDDARGSVRNDDAADDASRSDDGALRVNPGPSADPDDALRRDDENQASPPMTGSDARPNDMGPGSARGQ